MPRFSSACAVIALSLSASAAEPTRRAVVVGVNDYQHERLPSLKYAEADAVGLDEVLRAAGYDVTLLVSSVKDAGRTPTKANIDDSVAAVLKACRKGDTVVLAFAGHGLQFDGQPDAFFCPADARPLKDQTDSLVSLQAIYAQMKGSFAGMKVLLVDACRNDPEVTRGVRSGLTADAAPKPPQGVAALFSCKAGERAYEHDSLKHGVFFHHVLDGLRGKAKDGDGEVTFAALAGYVSKKVAKQVPTLVGEGAMQSPTLKAEYSTEPVLLTAPSSATVPPTGVIGKEPKPETPAIAGKEPKPGEEIDIEIAKEVKMTFCWIPAGEFWMGAAEGEAVAYKDEFPQRKLTMSGFWLGKTEVTQEQYEAVLGKNPSRYKGKKLPVETISWDDTQYFFKKLKDVKKPEDYEKCVFGLPSEAQWEYACRGNAKAEKKTTPFYFGTKLNGTEANCDGKSPYGTTTKGDDLAKTTFVGRYAKLEPHLWGLCDMHGNVREWCEDYYGSYDKVFGTKDPVQIVKQNTDSRVSRGGSWLSSANSCRSAFRCSASPGSSADNGGFRMAFRRDWTE